MLRIVVFIISFISFLICFQDNANPLYQYVYFLPLALAFFSFSDKFFFPYLKRSYVYYIFYFQAIIRYSIIPLGIALGDKFTNGFTSLNGSLAVLFMIIELFFIWVVFLSQNHKYKRTHISNKLILVRKNGWLYIFILLMFFVVFLSGYFYKVNLIWSLANYVEDVTQENTEEVGTIGGLLFNPLKVAIMLIAASWILGSKLSKRSKLISLILIMGLASMFIVGISRLSIVAFILPFYFILHGIFDKKNIKIINTVLLLLMVPVIVITSIAKFSRPSKAVTTETIFNTNSYNAYFAGVGNVAAGIDAHEKLTNKNYVLFFFNDILQNVPILSKLTIDNYKSNFIYNYEIYGHSLWQTQIVPLNIAGLFHFDILGIGLYSALFLWIAFFFEKKALNENYLPYKFVFFAIMLSVSMIFMLNIGSMVVTIIRSILFTYLPFYLSNKLNKIK